MRQLILEKHFINNVLNQLFNIFYLPSMPVEYRGLMTIHLSRIGRG